MASVNKVIAIGNLGKDPEVKYAQSGDAVCSFSIACNETWKDKDGEKQEKTEWIRCVAFKRPAEVIGEYVKKGDPIYIEGRLQTRKYEKDGQDHYTTEVIVDRFQFLKGRDSQGDESERREERRVSSNQRKTKPAGAVDDFDDDIPF